MNIDYSNDFQEINAPIIHRSLWHIFNMYMYDCMRFISHCVTISVCDARLSREKGSVVHHDSIDLMSVYESGRNQLVNVASIEVMKLGIIKY